MKQPSLSGIKKINDYKSHSRHICIIILSKYSFFIGLNQVDPVSIGGIVLSVLDKFFPNQTEIKKADLELKKAAIEAEVSLKLSQIGLYTKQIDVNQAEAANPNRKWATWREMIGYAGAIALWYFWILQPLALFISVAIGHPLNKEQLPEFDVLQVIYVMMGMLGLDAAPIMANGIKSKISRK